MTEQQTQPPAESGLKSALVIGGVVIGVILLMGLVGLFFFGQVRNGYYAAQLVSGHETVTAQVYEAGRRRHASSYRFNVNGAEYRGRGGREEQGQSLEIAYRAGDPEVNRPARGLWFDILFATAIVLAAPVLIGFAFVKERLEKRAAAAHPPADPEAPAPA